MSIPRCRKLVGARVYVTKNSSGSGKSRPNQTKLKGKLSRDIKYWYLRSANITWDRSKESFGLHIIRQSRVTSSCYTMCPPGREIFLCLGVARLSPHSLQRFPQQSSLNPPVMSQSTRPVRAPKEASHLDTHCTTKHLLPGHHIFKWIQVFLTFRR